MSDQLSRRLSSDDTRVQAFDGNVVEDWTALDSLCNVVMPCHDEPRPASLTADHYVEGVFDAMRRAEDDYPWRYGVVPGGPYA